MKIQFLIFSPHQEKILDTDYPEKNPLGGSETAALKMVALLRNQGHQVEILIHPDQAQNNSCDIFISLRILSTFEKGILPGKLNYLWCQDDSDQPVVSSLKDPEVAARFWKVCDGAFMISHYQVARWQKDLHLPLEKVFLTQNGISKKQFQIDPTTLANRPKRAYYSSTPFRGLHLLLDLWPHVLDLVPDAELDIMSSMGTYQVKKKIATLRLYSKKRSR